MSVKKALLIDIKECIGCGACYEACKEENHLPVTSDDPLKDILSDKTYTALDVRGDYYVRKMCRHCEDPACASVCPVGAFEKTKEGAVLYDESKCMGCRYCMQACPFQIPRYEWGSINPRIQKCILCHERIKRGEQTACAEACSVGATVFGDRDEIIKEAFSRLESDPDGYYQGIYGIEEAGGTCVLYISPVPFDQVGLNTKVPKRALPDFTWEALSKIPTVVTVGGVMLSGFYWLTNRKNEIAREERAEKINNGKGE